MFSFVLLDKETSSPTEPSLDALYNVPLIITDVTFTFGSKLNLIFPIAELEPNLIAFVSSENNFEKSYFFLVVFAFFVCFGFSSVGSVFGFATIFFLDFF